MADLIRTNTRPELMPGQTWTNTRVAPYGSAQGLVIEPTELGDVVVNMWVSIDGDGPSLLLDADQCREIAATLTARADMLGGQH